MPIKVPNDLPAIDTLTEENVFVMTDTRAITQDMRPLHILLLNLMPTKIETETQLTRLLGNTPLQIELELLHNIKHFVSSAALVSSFYVNITEGISDILIHSRINAHSRYDCNAHTQNTCGDTFRRSRYLRNRYASERKETDQDFPEI